MDYWIGGLVRGLGGVACSVLRISWSVYSGGAVCCPGAVVMYFMLGFFGGKVGVPHTDLQALVHPVPQPGEPGVGDRGIGLRGMTINGPDMGEPKSEKIKKGG